MNTTLQSARTGLTFCAGLGLASVLLGTAIPALSPLLIAIILGTVIRNVAPLPKVWEPGIGFAAKHVLRWGVVLLGLQISFKTIVDLGPNALVLIICAVAITFFATLALGRVLKVDSDLTLLIASGFSICGAAAVAGVQGTIKAAQEKVAAAIALVVLFGTLMIPATVALAAALDFADEASGVFIGGATHEVAQVVAAAGITGGNSVLAIAVTVKLARVALLAPVVAGISLARRRSQPMTEGSKRPPILPLFLIGFIAMMAVATLDLLPEIALDLSALVQQFLLATAMFALGLGVHFKSLKVLGARPLLLGLGSTAVITCVALTGISLGAGT